MSKHKKRKKYTYKFRPNGPFIISNTALLGLLPSFIVGLIIIFLLVFRSNSLGLPYQDYAPLKISTKPIHDLAMQVQQVENRLLHEITSLQLPSISFPKHESATKPPAVSHRTNNKAGSITPILKSLSQHISDIAQAFDPRPLFTDAARTSASFITNTTHSISDAVIYNLAAFFKLLDPRPGLSAIKQGVDHQVANISNYFGQFTPYTNAVWNAFKQSANDLFQGFAADFHFIFTAGKKN